MNSFLETIRVEQGRAHLLKFHQQRMAATIREVYGDSAPVPSLEETLRDSVAIPDAGLYKCRVVYDSTIRRIELEPYTLRPVRSLRLVVAPVDLDYHLKSADRCALAALAAGKDGCDEVIIVRDGLVTDTSYTNLLFRTTDGRLLTPRTPLLSGTMRRHLLDAGLVSEADITPCELVPGNSAHITHALLINAMMPLGRAPEIPVSAIVG